MFLEFLLSNFEMFIFFSITLIVIGFFLLFFLQNQNFKNNKNSIIEYGNMINSSNEESKEYFVGIGNILEQQKNEIIKISEKVSFIEREINRLGNIKGSEDMLGIAIDMARNVSPIRFSVESNSLCQKGIFFGLPTSFLSFGFEKLFFLDCR